MSSEHSAGSPTLLVNTIELLPQPSSQQLAKPLLAAAVWGGIDSRDDQGACVGMRLGHHPLLHDVAKPRLGDLAPGTGANRRPGLSVHAKNRCHTAPGPRHPIRQGRSSVALPVRWHPRPCRYELSRLTLPGEI
jgi:hypothetical protein